VDENGNIYLAGNTNSKAIPTTPGAFQTALAGQGDGYVAKISALLASTTSLSVSPNPASVGQKVTLTAQVTGKKGSATPTGSVVFNLAGSEFGTGTLDKTGKATYTTSTLAAGAYSFTAVYSGNGTYAESTSTPEALTVKASQTITFGPIPTQKVGGSVALSATASSGLTVGFSSLTTKVCTVSGTTANLLSSGTCTIAANQAGNTEFAAAPTVKQSFTVSSSSGPGFKITPEPASEKVKRGDVAKFELEVRSEDGFKGKVTLTCSGGPVGSSCEDLPKTISVTKKATVKSGILFSKSTVPGVYTLTFTGTSGALTSSVNAKFTVTK
jgi:hypothetical protein